jgi:hypothetical protein
VKGKPLSAEVLAPDLKPSAEGNKWVLGTAKELSTLSQTPEEKAADVQRRFTFNDKVNTELKDHFKKYEFGTMGLLGSPGQIPRQSVADRIAAMRQEQMFSSMSTNEIVAISPKAFKEMVIKETNKVVGDYEQFYLQLEKKFGEKRAKVEADKPGGLNEKFHKKWGFVPTREQNSILFPGLTGSDPTVPGQRNILEQR